MRKALLRVLWAVAIYAALTLCALAAVNLYAKSVLPFYRWELGWIAPEYDVQQFDVDRARGELAFDVLATNRGHLYLIDRVVPPRSLTFRVHLLVMRGLEHTVMLLFVPLAWPGLGWKQRAVALAWAIPILCFVEFADLPWVMVGGFDQIKSRAFQTSDSLPIVWSQIEESGGSLALGLAGGGLACQMPAIFENSRLRKLRRGKSGKRPASRKRARI
ncbi:MAG: hypothetical protein ACLPY1_03620 [Terracidiphilus sp.]